MKEKFVSNKYVDPLGQIRLWVGGGKTSFKRKVKFTKNGSEYVCCSITYSEVECMKKSPGLSPRRCSVLLSTLGMATLNLLFNAVRREMFDRVQKTRKKRA